MNKGVENFDGGKLKELREDKGWTMQDVGTKIGVAASAIMRWEAGTHSPKREYLKKLANLFGVSKKEFLTESEVSA